MVWKGEPETKIAVLMRFKTRNMSVRRKGMGWVWKCLAKIGRAPCRGPKIGKVCSPTSPCSTASRHESEPLLPRDRGTLRGAQSRRWRVDLVPICVLRSVLESGCLPRYHFLLLGLSDLPTLPLSSRLADIVFSILDAYCVYMY